MKERPIGVTILAILAGIAAVLAAIPCAPVLTHLPILHRSQRLYCPVLQLLVCSDVWIACLGIHLADDDALAG